MEAILSLLGKILSILSQNQLAQEARDFASAAYVSANATEIAVFNQTYGLKAAHNERVAMNNATLDRDSVVAVNLDGLYHQGEAILAAIGEPSQATTPPTWWVTPPTPPATGDIASAVWSFAPTLQDPTAWDHLDKIENFARNIGFLAAFPLQSDPFLMVETSWKYPPD